MVKLLKRGGLNNIMNTYLITYESILSEYSLISKIKTFQLWARPMKDVWLIRTTSDRISVFNYLTNNSYYFTGKILVIKVTNDWIAKNLANDVVNWMQGGLE